MLRLWPKWLLLSSLVLVTACSAPSTEHAATANAIGDAPPLRVVAATDLRYALDSLLLVFAQQPTVQVTVTYGSSGKFYEQLRHGAPFDVFFSADSDYPRQL